MTDYIVERSVYTPWTVGWVSASADISQVWKLHAPSQNSLGRSWGLLVEFQWLARAPPGQLGSILCPPPPAEFLVGKAVCAPPAQQGWIL